MNEPLVTAFDHVATATADLDVALAFYKRVFGLEPLPGFPRATPDGRRLAILKVGAGPALQLIECEKVEAPARIRPPGAVFYGSIRFDHVSFAAPNEASFDEIRRRLVEAGASDGEVQVFGAQRLVTFKDPDGWLAEVVLS